MENSETQSTKAEFNPQAIVDYYYSTNGSGGKRKETKDLLMKAKQHLSAVGWSFHYLIRKCGKKEPRYSAPNATKKYLSLRTACKAYLDSESQLGESNNHVLRPKFVGEADTVDVEKNKKRELCSIDDQCDERMPFMQGTENSVKEVDVYVQSYSSMQHENREFRNDLLEDGEQINVVRDLEKISVDDTKGIYGELDKGVKKQKIGGKNMNVLRRKLRESSVDGRKDTKLAKGVDKGKIGDTYWLRAVNNQVKSVNNQLKAASNGTVTPTLNEDQSDDVCSICREGGDLLLCDQCPSAFHADCVGLSGVPSSEFWYCKSCSCRICGQNIFRDDSHIPNRQCDQCEQHFHGKCVSEYNVEELERKKWFCSKKCQDISYGLDRLLGKPIAVGNNLTWILLKNNNNVNDPKTTRKLKSAVAVMHECFEPVKEPWGGRDVGEDVIFSRKSDLKQIDYRGFYTLILQKGNIVVTFATVRVFGDKVAEVPFIATRLKYRRQGMCKILMNVLEEKLTNMGVQKLVLPAMLSVLDTWTSPSFAFTEMTASDRSILMDCSFLEFPGTIACQKLLQKSDANL